MATGPCQTGGTGKPCPEQGWEPLPHSEQLFISLFGNSVDFSNVADFQLTAHFKSNAQMFTTAKSLPEPGHGPFHMPLSWWTCTCFYWRPVVPVWWEWKSGSFFYNENSPVECMHGRLRVVNMCAVICPLINKTHLCRYLARFSCSLSLLYRSR